MFALLLAALAAPPGQADADLGAKAMAVLQKHCGACHGATRASGPLDVRDYKTTVTASRKGKPYFAAKDADKSFAWQRIAVEKDMPQDGEMPAADQDVLKAWIAAGVPAPAKVVAKARPFVSVKDVLKAAYDDLKDADEEDRPYLRYFTLSHLSNNPAIDDAKLARFRAGLSKVLNSMHWSPRVVVPRAVDKAATVLAIDLRDLEWDRKGDEKQDRWAVMLSRYPYGLEHADPDDPAVEKLDRDLYKLADRTLVVMRADWFMARAARPPLYEAVLRLPATVEPLEAKLGVDVAENFRRNRLARAGYARSFVSGQNRLVERHDALYGAYWKSYDFLKGAERGELLKFPLGPVFAGAKKAPVDYGAAAFRHDGGEMIFHLPNGMQGYYLSDGKGKHLSKGPVDVVSDPNMRSGTAEIVNGLSCMCCHQKGMIDSVLDDVRKGTSLEGDLLRKVRKLYPTRERMLQHVEEDNDRFRAALTKTMKPFLAAEDAAKVATEVKEPLTELLKDYYQVDPGIDVVAFELGYRKADDLRAAIRASSRLKGLGLGALPTGGVLKREFWDNGDKLEKPDEAGQSLFHKAASELGLGSPRRFK